MLPVFLKRPGVQIPDHVSTAHVVATNGVFLRIRNNWLAATVPIDVATLERERPQAQLLLPPIDAVVVGQVLLFFRRIYQLYRSEAAVLLHHGPAGWACTVPPQIVSAAHVHYDMSERIPGYSCVGTMHSHGSLVARHSSVDDADEADFDGVHIIIGDLNQRSKFSMEASLVVRSHRFCIDTHVGGVQEDGRFSWQDRRGAYSFHSDAPALMDWEVPESWVNNVTHSSSARLPQASSPTRGVLHEET
ncbi:MAG: Mov34/MPN/PAD-1 family protein [Candidatus Pacebacteria bacterium]|nr:Mov34/MPN/PAD-1 family protein [Candidatus Paceibacterota bacterium]